MLHMLDFLQFLMWVEFSLDCKVYQLKHAVTTAEFFTISTERKRIEIPETVRIYIRYLFYRDIPASLMPFVLIFRFRCHTAYKNQNQNRCFHPCGVHARVEESNSLNSEPITCQFKVYLH